MGFRGVLKEVRRSDRGGDAECVEGSGFRVQGAGCRVQGVGFRPVSTQWTFFLELFGRTPWYILQEGSVSEITFTNGYLGRAQTLPRTGGISRECTAKRNGICASH